MSLTVTETIWSVIFALGTIQGSLVCIALSIAKQRNRNGALALAGLSAVMTLMIVTELVELLGFRPWNLWLNAATINGELLLGPLLYVLALSVVQTAPFMQQLGRALAAFTLATLCWIALVANIGPAAYNDPLSGVIQPWVALYVTAKALWVFGYLLHGYRSLAGTSEKSAVLVRRLLIAITCSCALIYANFYANLFGYRALPDSDLVGSMLLALLIYGLSWTVMIHPGLLSSVPRAQPDKQLRRQWEPRIREFFEQQSGHLDPELSLGSMASQIGISQNQLSDLLNRTMQSSFHELVSNYRLDSYEQLRRNSPGKTVLSLAMDAGFNSKASFYRAFKARHGMSPAQHLALNSTATRN